MSRKRGKSVDLPPELLQTLEQLLMGGAAPLTAESIAAELSELPRCAEDWLVVTRSAEIEGMALLLSLVVCPDIPVPVIFQPMDNAEELLRFITESMGMGQGEGEATWEPYVPARFLVSDAQLAFSWGNLLREAGIKVELGVPLELEKMVQEAAQLLEQEMSSAGQALPFLSDKTPQEAECFLAAFDGFMKSKPWKWLDSRPLFVQWQNEAGQPHSFYAVVMGHEGQVFGLSLFGSWTEYLEVFLAGSETESMAAVIAQGGREAVALAQTGNELADEDWAFMQQHKLTRKKRENWSGGVQQRIGLEGAASPRFPLPILTEMLNLVAENAPAARHEFLTSFKRKSGTLRLSYPATARDELTPEEAAGWIRLRVQVRDRRFEYRERKTRTVEIVAPGDTLLAKVFNGKQFQQLWQSQADELGWSKSERGLLGYDLPDRIYRLVELDGEQTQLYLYSRGETNPTLAQLLKLSEQETIYVSGVFDRDTDDYQPISLQIERVDGPMAEPDAEQKGVAMRWEEQ